MFASTQVADSCAGAAIQAAVEALQVRVTEVADLARQTASFVIAMCHHSMHCSGEYISITSHGCSLTGWFWRQAARFHEQPAVCWSARAPAP